VLTDPWWSTPNIHLSTLRDFTDLCADLDLRIESAAALTTGRPARAMDPNGVLENWRAESALFLLSRAGGVRTEVAGGKSDLFG
jgi:hypothetical protein